MYGSMHEIHRVVCEILRVMSEIDRVVKIRPIFFNISSVLCLKCIELCVKSSIILMKSIEKSLKLILQLNTWVELLNICLLTFELSLF